MKRSTVAPRPNWEKRVEEQGLVFHSVEHATYEEVSDYRASAYRSAPQMKETTRFENVTYWAEGTYYEFTSDEVDRLETATNAIQEMAIKAAENVITNKRYAEIGIPEVAVPLIEETWNSEPPSLYGRMDLVLTREGGVKLLEYNADTPTSLLEAAVIQWTWMQDCFKGADQFNSMHERLIKKWRELKDYLYKGPVHFAHMESIEDEMTVGYLRDTAEQAGLKTQSIRMDKIGWHDTKRCFTDEAEGRIRNVFKLYPWEWLLKDSFGANLDYDVRGNRTFWLEPAWKMVLSSKGILPILWELFPGHPNLLPAFFREDDRYMNGWVKKPLYGREGSNVTINAPGVSMSTSGTYENEGFVYQEYVEIPEFDGYKPVIGSWVIDQESAGMGIRETAGYVTNNTARFVPHIFR